MTGLRHRPAWRRLVSGPEFRRVVADGCVQAHRLVRDYVVVHCGELPVGVSVPLEYSIGAVGISATMEDGRVFYGICDTYAIDAEDYYWDVRMCWESGCRGAQDARECAGVLGCRSRAPS